MTKKESDKKYYERKMKDPVWVEKERARSREKQKKKHETDPEYNRKISRKYQSKKREKIKRAGLVSSYGKEHRKRYSSSISVTKKNWTLKNNERVLNKVQEYRRTSKGKEVRRNSGAKRRARMQVTDIDADFLLKIKAETISCSLCPEVLTDQNRELDHIIPLCIGGMHMKNNVRFICGKCNRCRPRTKFGIDKEIFHTLEAN